LIVELSNAPDVRHGMTRVISTLRRRCGAKRVEWWGPSEDNSRLRLDAADGSAAGPRFGLSLGPAGAVVVCGHDCSPELAHAVARLLPVLRRRWTDEQLSLHAERLGRQNEALDDFAALVAHELKTPLHAALHLADPAAGIEGALALIDLLLEVARAEAAAGASASVGDCLDDVLRDLDVRGVGVASDVDHACPLPQSVLRVLLRNLLANALAAGAQHVRVSTVVSEEEWTLVVDDDGVGVEAVKGYAAGSELGLGLCRRLAARFGVAVELRPRAYGGTSATLKLARSEA
jgi:signal transduction histidine kinase